MAKRNAVIFDLFGTLVPSWSKQMLKECLMKMAEAIGARLQEFQDKWTFETYNARAAGKYSSIEENLYDICQRIGLSVEDNAIKRAAEIRRKFQRLSLRPRPDAIIVLTELRRKGLSLGLISDCSADVPELWGETALSAFFQMVTFSCIAHLTKPDPCIYKMTCNALRVEPGLCYYVGDGCSQELTGAKSLGMLAILLRLPLSERLSTLETEADTWDGDSVSSLTEAASLIKAMQENKS